ncbi:phosphoesterase [Clostridia bacterium]|nr:phosphoesterase [Clostridia bacterium]
MKILVFSDSHGHLDNMTGVTTRLASSVDYIIHLGDLERDGEKLHELFPAIPMFAVSGNNDYYSSLPSTRSVEIGGVKFYLTHGHLHTRENLVQFAKRTGASVALYGHLHQYYESYADGVYIASPGSISRPRGGQRPSYLVVDLSGGGIGIKIMTL